GLADARVVERRHAHVHAERGVVHGRHAQVDEVVVALEIGEVELGDRGALDVELAALVGLEQGLLVEDDLLGPFVEVGQPGIPVVGVALEDGALAVHVGVDDEGAGADAAGAQVATGLDVFAGDDRGLDAEPVAAAEREEGVGIGHLRREAEGLRVDRLHLIDVLLEEVVVERIREIAESLVAVDDVFSGDFAAVHRGDIVELYARADLEDVLGIANLLDAFSDEGVERRVDRVERTEKSVDLVRNSEASGCLDVRIDVDRVEVGTSAKRSASNRFGILCSSTGGYTSLRWRGLRRSFANRNVVIVVATTTNNGEGGEAATSDASSTEEPPAVQPPVIESTPIVLPIHR